MKAHYRSRTEKAGSLLTFVYLPIALFTLWFLSSRDSLSPFFPPLRVSLARFLDFVSGPALARDVLPSLGHFAVGFVFGSVIGIAVGVVLGVSMRARRAALPLIEVARATPIAAVVPLALILFGRGLVMESAVIALGVTWPILINTVDGIRSVDPLAMDVCRSYGFSKSAIVFRVQMRAASPLIFAGMRIAVAIGLQLMVFANMFGGSKGLGHFVSLSQQSFDIPGMWAGVFTIASVALILVAVFGATERAALRWHRGWRRSQNS